MDNHLVLQHSLTNPDVVWQVHNCKISEQTVTQDGQLPFVYHYDILPAEIKSAHPLDAELLKAFNTLMTTEEVAQKLGISVALIPTPWFVKIVGTAVLFCERLQLAIRLKFTNTAKKQDPIYCGSTDEAIKIAMQDWHCFESVFVLNKSSQLVKVLGENQKNSNIETENETENSMNDDSYFFFELLPKPEYQPLPTPYALAILSLIDADTSKHNHIRQQLDNAIKNRLT